MVILQYEMTLGSHEFYEGRANIAKALEHPSRLLLLDALREQERCACDLTKLVGADQSTVSKHLSVLKAAGVVQVRKQGPLSFYRTTSRCLDGLFTSPESVLKEKIEAQRAVLSG